MWDEFSEGTSDAESDYDYEYEDKQRTNMIRRGIVYTVRNPPLYHKGALLSTTRLEF
jgi:alpha-D-ribose 1-methylphosphonate 5-phosphate C-P lyase